MGFHSVMAYSLQCVKVVSVTDSDRLQVLAMHLLLVWTMMIAMTMTTSGMMTTTMIMLMTTRRVFDAEDDGVLDSTYHDL